MSKFFTPLLALLLALTREALASESMPTLPPPAPGVELPPAAGGNSGLPASLVSGRFASLARKSPFTLASTTEENADFAKDLVLAGYVRMDGQDFVLVANRTRPERLMVGTKPSAGALGMILLKVERDASGDPTKLRAQIRKGTETAVLKYEVAPASVAAQAAQAGQPQPAAPVQSAPGQAPSAGKPPGVTLPGQAAPQNPPVVRRRTPPIPSLPGR